MMALMTRTGDQRWETHDGRFYLYGEYKGGHSKVCYSIGEHTQEGDQHIEDVYGLREARAYLKQLLEGVK
jgi:hypothetical protein